MTILWIILGLPVLVLLGWSDQLLVMAMDAYAFRRTDDKPARRRLVTPSNALPAGGERVSQPLSLLRRSRPIDSGAAAGDGKHPHASAIIGGNRASVRRAL